MATLKETLRTQLTISMKARTELRSSTIRMLLSAITNAEVAGATARTLSDDEVTSVLATESKKRREASSAFAAAGRTELADKELAELAIIAEFLPAPLTDDEIRDLVTTTIADLGVAGSGMSAMGKVMGALTPQTRGRADGAAVSAEVRRQLA
jgi:uncharacterized protein YqeY